MESPFKLETLAKGLETLSLQVTVLEEANRTFLAKSNQALTQSFRALTKEGAKLRDKAESGDPLVNHFKGKMESGTGTTSSLAPSLP